MLFRSDLSKRVTRAIVIADGEIVEELRNTPAARQTPEPDTTAHESSREPALV